MKKKEYEGNVKAKLLGKDRVDICPPNTLWAIDLAKAIYGEEIKKTKCKKNR